MSACSGLAQFQSIDCFDALDELHKGRHSTVWSAKYRPTGELVGYSRSALKPRQLAHVYSEINILNALNAARHPGVVTLLASFDTSEFVYLVFEACMRGDLYQLLLREKGRLDEQYLGRVLLRRWLQIMRPLLTTLAQLHSRGIIHRDVKPENIFLTLDGEVQLGDFGLAATKGCDKLTERVGTLDYLSPEVLAMPTPNEAAVGRGGVLQPYDEKVDVWALGCLCFEMLAGKPPFEVEDPKE
ncbi:protein kinase domain-containing protein, partial [Haematococcus lacustris]